MSVADRATDLEQHVDRVAVRLLEALVCGDRRRALRALADSQALDLPAARLALARWVRRAPRRPGGMSGPHRGTQVPFLSCA